MPQKTPNYSKLLKRHAEMVFDFRRTLPLVRAIRKTVRPGDIVVDLGCGMGILSFAAVHAGAKRVYAIDIDSESLDYARWQTKQLGMEQKICFFEDHSYNVDLIEKSDLLIQETVGRLGFDENFLPALADAKKRLLKPGGKVIPQIVALHGAIVDAKEKFLTAPKILAQVNATKAFPEELQTITRWSGGKTGTVDGVLAWPVVTWSAGLTTDAAPNQPPTHWRQTLLPIKPFAIRAGDPLVFAFSCHPNPTDPHSSSKMEWKLTKETKSSKGTTR